MAAIDLTKQAANAVPTCVGAALFAKLQQACRQSDAAEVKTLLQRNLASAGRCDRLGNTILHLAAKSGSAPTVMAVVFNSSVLVDDANRFGQTALSIAARYGFLEVVRTLLMSGSKPNAKTDILGMSPLHWAVDNGFTECVTLLVRYGASTTTPDKYNRTPESLAKSKESEDISKILATTKPDPHPQFFTTNFSNDFISSGHHHQIKVKNKPPEPPKEVPMTEVPSSSTYIPDIAQHNPLPQCSESFTAAAPSEMSSPPRKAWHGRRRGGDLSLTEGGHLILNSILEAKRKKTS